MVLISIVYVGELQSFMLLPIGMFFCMSGPGRETELKYATLWTQK